MTIEATETYHQNLSAWRSVQPDLAGCVDATPLPPQAQIAPGRDGSQTAQLPDESGRMVWLGGSSMPTISAGELMGGFRYAGGNLSLLGIQTGVEPLLILDRLPPHAALFVIEADPLAMKLAMHLHDYAGAIRSGKLVIMLEASLAESMHALFDAHPGYEFPGRLLTLPHCPLVRVSEVQRLLESATDAITTSQLRRIEGHIERIRQVGPKPIGDGPTVAVVGTDASTLCVAYARNLTRSAQSLGWSAACHVPDAPDRCHIAAAMALIDECGAQCVIVAGPGGTQFRSLLPESMPVVSWLPPGAPTDALAESAGGGRHLMAIATHPQQQALRAKGVAESELLLVGPGVDLIEAAPKARNDSPDSPKRVAMIVDVPEDRASAAGVTLASHLRLYEMMQTLLRDAVEDYRSENAEAILATAQRRSRVELQEAKLHDLFAELLRQRIAPAAIVRMTLQTLHSLNLPVDVWGSDWPAKDAAHTTYRGPIPTEVSACLSDVDVVVFPALPPARAQTWLEASLVTDLVVCHASALTTLQSLPTLADLVAGTSTYRTSRSLATVLAQPGGRRRADDGSAAAPYALAAQLQSVVHRLR